VQSAKYTSLTEYRSHNGMGVKWAWQELEAEMEKENAIAAWSERSHPLGLCN